MRFARAAALTSAVLSGALGLGACASRATVTSDYVSAVRDTPQREGDAHGRTVVLFLVDGLSNSALQTRLEDARKLKQSSPIRDYFLTGGRQAYLGHAVFPSLTYPNISSILTASSVDQHGITGNQVVYGGAAHDFDEPWETALLNTTLGSRTVFSALKAQHYNSVSLDLYFSQGATSFFGPDAKTGAAYLARDYDYVDRRTLGGLTHLLDETSVKRWPEFIFVHLVGVDGIGHDRGPRSPEARKYLSRLDHEMQAAFDQLREGESQGREIISILTADHGFMTIQRRLDLTAQLKRTDPNIRVQNESRLANLYFPPEWSWQQRGELLRGLSRQEGIGATFQRLGSGAFDDVAIETRDLGATLHYRAAACPRVSYAVSIKIERGANAGSMTPYLCPEAFDDETQFFVAPYFVSNVAAFYASPVAPPAVVMAGEGVSFNMSNFGDHGGVTPEEVFVPILMRGARPGGGLGLPGHAMPTRDLLAFLKTSPGANVVGAQIAQGYPSDAADPGLGHSQAELKSSQLLEISTPLTFVNFESRGLDGSDRYSLSSRLSPELRLDLKQGWTPLLATSVGYQATFYSFQANDASMVSPISTSTSTFRLGGHYRFGPSDTVSLYGVMGQQLFTQSFQPGAISLTTAWVPELDFVTQGRILSLGLGDLLLRGSFGLLFPAVDTDVNASIGYEFGSQLVFARPIATADLLSFFAGASLRSQATDTERRQDAVIRLGVSYGLSFTDR